MSSISVSDLRTISAKAIQALPHPTPIKDGKVTVGFLVPVRGARQMRVRSDNKDWLREMFSRIEEAEAERTPEQQQAIDKLLAERGIE